MSSPPCYFIVCVPCVTALPADDAAVAENRLGDFRVGGIESLRPL